MKKYIEITSNDSQEIIKCYTFAQVFKEIERRKTFEIKTKTEDKKIKLSSGFYRDKNKNKWDCNKFTELEALKASESLLNCRNCRDCTDCTNCVLCMNCANCTDCTNSYNKCGINGEKNEN